MNWGLSLTSNREVWRWSTHKISLVNRFASYVVKTKMFPFNFSHWFFFPCNKNFGFQGNYDVCNPHHKKSKLTTQPPKPSSLKMVDPTHTAVAGKFHDMESRSWISFDIWRLWNLIHGLRLFENRDCIFLKKIEVPVYNNARGKQDVSVLFLNCRIILL